MKYTQEIMQFIVLFENITRAKVKDCFVNDNVNFVVEKGYLGRAIGRNGSNIKAVERLIKKKIRLIEFNDDIKEFIKKIINVEAKEIYTEENVLKIVVDEKDRGRLIGRNKKNLIEIKEMVGKYFKINDVKVV